MHVCYIYMYVCTYVHAGITLLCMCESKIFNLLYKDKIQEYPEIELHNGCV